MFEINTVSPALNWSASATVIVVVPVVYVESSDVTTAPIPKTIVTESEPSAFAALVTLDAPLAQVFTC